MVEESASPPPATLPAATPLAAPAAPREVATPREKDTLRVEAFSDGVMAIAITLLVIELHVPDASTKDLTAALADEWPSYLAFITSFLTILIVWINHHRIFCLLGRIDAPLLFLNGMLLLAVAFIPYATAVLATHILGPEARTAALLYAGTGLFLALTFNGLWRYAAGGRRLIQESAPQREVDAINREYWAGPIFYGAAVGLAFVFPLGSFALCTVLAGFFAVTAKL
ncbi:MAG TPA: TMEM175 family protein [Candidatus Thermoplasmatota archaeon]